MGTVSEQIGTDIYRDGDWVRMPAYRWKEIAIEIERLRKLLRDMLEDDDVPDRWALRIREALGDAD